MPLFLLAGYDKLDLKCLGVDKEFKAINSKEPLPRWRTGPKVTMRKLLLQEKSEDNNEQMEQNGSKSESPRDEDTVSTVYSNVGEKQNLKIIM